MTTELEAAIAVAEDMAGAIPYWKRPVLPPIVAPRVTYQGTIYLGGPVSGQTYDAARYGWREQFVLAMPYGIVCLSPMRHEGHLKEVGIINDESLPSHPFSGHKFIFHKDAFDIRQSDLVVFNFLEGPVSISKGSLVELGMAYAYGKTILVAMGAGNIHQHIFVREAALVFDKFDDLTEAAKGLLSEGI